MTLSFFYLEIRAYIFPGTVNLPFFLERETEHGISVGCGKIKLILKSETREQIYKFKTWRKLHFIINYNTYTTRYCHFHMPIFHFIHIYIYCGSVWAEIRQLTTSSANLASSSSSSISSSGRILLTTSEMTISCSRRDFPKQQQLRPRRLGVGIMLMDSRRFVTEAERWWTEAENSRTGNRDITWKDIPHVHICSPIKSQPLIGAQLRECRGNAANPIQAQIEIRDRCGCGQSV